MPVLESYSDFKDWLENSEVCDKDISCEDGVCPDCNYKKYLEWVLYSAHEHCDQPLHGIVLMKRIVLGIKSLFDFKG